MQIDYHDRKRHGDYPPAERHFVARFERDEVVAWAQRHSGMFSRIIVRGIISKAEATLCAIVF
jgi:hypothetical protein